MVREKGMLLLYIFCKVIELPLNILIWNLHKFKVWYIYTVKVFWQKHAHTRNQTNISIWKNPFACSIVFNSTNVYPGMSLFFEIPFLFMSTFTSFIFIQDVLLCFCPEVFLYYPFNLLSGIPTQTNTFQLSYDSLQPISCRSPRSISQSILHFSIFPNNILCILSQSAWIEDFCFSATAPLLLHCPVLMELQWMVNVQPCGWWWWWCKDDMDSSEWVVEGYTCIYDEYIRVRQGLYRVMSMCMHKERSRMSIKEKGFWSPRLTFFSI